MSVSLLPKEEGFDVLLADAGLIRPPAAEGLIKRDVEGLGWLVIEVADSLVELEEGEGEFPVGDPLGLELENFYEFVVYFKFHVTIDVDIGDC